MSRFEDLRALIESGGKYQIISSNTEGMNSYGFRARHVPLDSPAFLKVYDVIPEGTDLYIEARVLKEMTDGQGTQGNLVRILDAERLDAETVVIAMEYVEGGSLLNQLRSRERFPLMEALKITIGILHGVAQLHSKSKVHRDLKPANILYDEKMRLPKIGDFGSVSELDSEGVSLRTSRRSALYIPPEGWQSPARHTKQSDLYQVGIVAHELINGALPYSYEAYLDAEALRALWRLNASTLGDVSDPVERDSVVNQAIARAASRRRLLHLCPSMPYLPDAVARVIRKATSPDARRRFGSASEMIAAMEQLHYPNWNLADHEYRATGWRQADWQVRTIDGRYIAHRRLSGKQWRQWRAQDSLPVLFAAIEAA